MCVQRAGRRATRRIAEINSSEKQIRIQNETFDLPLVECKCNIRAKYAVKIKILIITAS
jgi:hypothetical protein